MDDLAREYDARKEAFLQAGRDCRGDRTAAEVIDRAKVYLAFLLPEKTT